MKTVSALTVAPKPFALGVMLLLAQSTAYAHGEQIIFMPIGQVMALVLVAMIAVWAVRGIGARVAVVACAVGVGVLPWILPNAYLPWWALGTVEASFLTGLLPPVVIAMVVAWLARVSQGSRQHGT